MTKATSTSNRNLANIYFMILMIMLWSLNFVPREILERMGDDLTLNSVVSEIIISVPALLLIGIWYIGQAYKEHTFADYTAIPISDRLMFREVKVSTLLMTVVYTLMVLPLITLSNAISLLFVDNTMLEHSEDILSLSVVPAVFFTAMLPAFCEELAFRGMIYGGYRRECRPIGSVLMSALLFGLMHLNINQFSYAFVIGITMALLVEATGSIWPSILVHFIINSKSVIGMFIADHMYEGIFDEYLNEGMMDDTLGPAIILYAGISVVTTFIACVILGWLAKNEGRQNPLRQLVSNSMYKDKRHTVWTLPLIMGIIAALIYIILVEFAL